MLPSNEVAFGPVLRLLRYGGDPGDGEGAGVGDGAGEGFGDVIGGTGDGAGGCGLGKVGPGPGFGGSPVTSMVAELVPMTIPASATLNKKLMMPSRSHRNNVSG